MLLFDPHEWYIPKVLIISVHIYEHSDRASGFEVNVNRPGTVGSKHDWLVICQTGVWTPSKPPIVSFSKKSYPVSSSKYWLVPGFELSMIDIYKIACLTFELE